VDEAHIETLTKRTKLRKQETMRENEDHNGGVKEDTDDESLDDDNGQLMKDKLAAARQQSIGDYERFTGEFASVIKGSEQAIQDLDKFKKFSKNQKQREGQDEQEEDSGDSDGG
jgi:hypothetical protein